MDCEEDFAYESDEDEFADFGTDFNEGCVPGSAKDGVSKTDAECSISAPSTTSHLMELNDNKAGMQGLDKEKINQIIEAASKGSKFYEHKRKQQQRVDARIAELLERRKTTQSEHLIAATEKVDGFVRKLRNSRDLTRTIVHVDMDAFYAAVEIRDNPSLRFVWMFTTLVAIQSLIFADHEHSLKWSVYGPHITHRRGGWETADAWKEKVTSFGHSDVVAFSKMNTLVLPRKTMSVCMKEGRDKPMAVGGEGMLSTSNYAARRFGVRAAMPGFIARKLCPQLVIVPLNFKKYREVSAIVGAIFGRYDPNYAAMSLDEAYLDITDFMQNDHNLRIPDDGKSHAELVVEDIRAEIVAETELTASAGIAPNTFLAKVCSDINKPNGQFYLKPDVDVVMDFVRVLPVRKAFGIGKVTEQLLSSLGIVTCQDLFDQRGLLSILFTETAAMSFLRISLGLGSTHIGSDAPAKSVSTEQTFRDNNDPEFLRDKCKSLCEELSGDLKKRKLAAETVTLKLKTNKFDVKTRARRLPEYSNGGEVFWRHLRPLLEAEMGDGTISFRLMGVRASNLKDNDGTCGVQQRTLKDLVSNVKPAEKSCPVCSTSLKGKNSAEVNAHVDACLSAGLEKKEPEIECPVCNGVYPESKINAHVDACLDGASSTGTSGAGQQKRKSDVPVDDRLVKKSKKSKQVGLHAFFKKNSE